MQATLKQIPKKYKVKCFKNNSANIRPNIASATVNAASISCAMPVGYDAVNKRTVSLYIGNGHPFTFSGINVVLPVKKGSITANWNFIKIVSVDNSQYSQYVGHYLSTNNVVLATGESNYDESDIESNYDDETELDFTGRQKPVVCSVGVYVGNIYKSEIDNHNNLYVYPTAAILEKGTIINVVNHGIIKVADPTAQTQNLKFHKIVGGKYNGLYIPTYQLSCNTKISPSKNMPSKNESSYNDELSQFNPHFYPQYFL